METWGVGLEAALALEAGVGMLLATTLILYWKLAPLQVILEIALAMATLGALPIAWLVYTGRAEAAVALAGALAILILAMAVALTELQRRSAIKLFGVGGEDGG